MPVILWLVCKTGLLTSIMQRSVICTDNILTLKESVTALQTVAVCRNMLYFEMHAVTEPGVKNLLCAPGVCPEAAPRRRVPEEDGGAVWVRPVHCKFSQGETLLAAALKLKICAIVPHFEWLKIKGKALKKGCMFVSVCRSSLWPPGQVGRFPLPSVPGVLRLPPG